MTKLITWFKKIEDVERTLQWIEYNTDYRWAGWDKPTKYNWWKDNFNEYQEEWWFFINYKDKFMCWSMINIFWFSNFLEEQINFKDLIWENIKPWEYVYVSDKSVEDAIEAKIKRIYLWNFNWKNLCVTYFDEKFKKWKAYRTICWDYIAKIPKEETIKIIAENWQRLEITKKKANELWFNIN